MDRKKILIVGGVAGGASTAARVRRLDENAQIIMFEKGPNVSFSNCALPFHLSEVVYPSSKLVLMKPQQFKKQYNIDARVNSEVISIDRENKTVEVLDLVENRKYRESYDYLMLSPGANPIMPKSIEGIDLEHVFSVRNVEDIARIKIYIDENNIEDVAVIGGGFIGIEVIENLVHANKKVKLIEAAPQVMTVFDDDMAQILHREIANKGVELILNDGIKRIDRDYVELNSSRKVDAKAVIMAIGVSPDTKLAREAGLELTERGAIKVNHNYQTSDENIYAVGDAIEVTNLITQKPTRLTLAGPAQKQARAAAGHMYNRPSKNRGVIGSSVVRCFDLNAACTGLNEKACNDNDIPYDIAFIVPSDKVSLMPGVSPMFFKLVFHKPSGKILGAQAVGRGEVDKRINVIATMITMGGNLEDLAELELAYAPLFSTAKDVVNYAALVGLNILNGEYKQVHITKVRELVENNEFIIDAREKAEYENSHLINAVNIPLSEFRDRLDEIPKDRPVYIHCRSGQRSYNMVRALGNLGYKNVYNIAGSYIAISEYEWFRDKALNREKILTDYNFK